MTTSSCGISGIFDPCSDATQGRAEDPDADSLVRKKATFFEGSSARPITPHNPKNHAFDFVIPLRGISHAAMGSILAMKFGASEGM